MNIGFDFDKVLSEKYFQKLARKFIDDGHNVFIITSRSNRIGGWVVNDDNSDLQLIANELGIDRIIYTAHESKLLFMPDDTDIFFDDQSSEVEEVNKHMKNTVGICIREIDSSEFV